MSNLQQVSFNNLPANLPKSLANKILLDAVRQAGKIKQIGKPSFSFRGNAGVIQKATDEEIVLSGPAGTGKSLANLYKLHCLALHYPRMRGLIVRKTRESLTETALVTYEEDILGENNPIKEGPKRNFRQVYHYPNKSTIVVGGLDKSIKIMSSQYDMIFVPEATEITEGDWEALLTRLRNWRMPFQQLLADVNPDRPKHWLKQRADKGAIRLLETRHEDNPSLWDQEKKEWTEKGIAYIAKLEKLTGVRYLRLRKGLWVTAEGLILSDWDPAIHVIDPFPIPSNWRIIAGVDWGYTKPGTIVVIAIDGDGRAYIVHEVYRVQQKIAWWVQQGQRLKALYAIDVFYCDPSEPAYIKDFNDVGLNAVGADNSWHPGVQEVQQRLVVAEDGKARLYVFNNSLEERDKILDDEKQPCGFVEETEGFVWKKNSQGLKDEPADCPDHAQDAVRYPLYSTAVRGSVGNRRGTYGKSDIDFEF